MEAGGGTLGLLGGVGSNSNDSSSTNESTIVVETDELELGLGLSLGGGGGGGMAAKVGGAWGECGRILTAKDFPSTKRTTCDNKASNFSSSVSVSGNKRAAADSEGASPTAVSQVVGWPPIRSYRMNSLLNHAKAATPEDEKSICDKEKPRDAKKKICSKASNEKSHLGFVKVNVDGIAIGRKVDLNAHVSYETLAQALEDMFFGATANGTEKELTKLSKLLDGSSEFVLTYEDKEGDWMLVGDVPWGMFLSSVKRLRIMKTAEANGLSMLIFI
ncbi:hypothetical protein ACFE04_025818 [Oxalis oulophora]